MVATKPLYRVVLANAWQTTWRTKQLWLWGLFAGLIGNAGEYQFLVTTMRRAAGDESATPTAFVGPTATSTTALGFWQALTQDPFSIFVLLVIGLVVLGLAVFFLWLAIASVIALIRGVALAGAGKSLPPFADGLSSSRDVFAPVLVVSVFGRLVVGLLITLVALFGSLALIDPFVGLPLFLVSFLVLVPALLAIAFLVRFTVLFMVLKGRTAVQAFEEAVALFRRYWIIAVELALILFAISAAVAAVLIAVIWVVVLPALIAALVLTQAGYIGWASLLAILAILLFVALLFLLAAALATFQWAAWTDLFMKLQRNRVLSKVARLLGRFVPNRTVGLRRRT